MHAAEDSRGANPVAGLHRFLGPRLELLVLPCYGAVVIILDEQSGVLIMPLLQQILHHEGIRPGNTELCWIR